jgi:hypothetical protein
LRHDIGKSSPPRIIPAFILAPDFTQIGIDGIFLIRGSRPDVREAAGGKVDGLFGLNKGYASYGGYPGTGGGEVGLEFRFIVAVFGEAIVSWSKIVAREEDAFPSCPELREEIIDLGYVGEGNFLLVFAVGEGDSVGNLVIREFGEGEKEVEVRFVNVGCYCRQVFVWN